MEMLKKLMRRKIYTFLAALLASLVSVEVCAGNFEQIAKARHIIIMHIDSAKALPKKNPGGDGIGEPGPVGDYFVVAKGSVQRDVFNGESIAEEKKDISICVSGGVNVGSNYLVFTDDDLNGGHCSSAVVFLIQSSSGKSSGENIFIDYSLLGFLPTKIKVHQTALKYSGFEVDEKHCNSEKTGIIFTQAYVEMKDFMDLISSVRSR